MAGDDDSQKGVSGTLLSGRGKRELLIGVSLLALPLILLRVFQISIGSSLYALAAIFGVFLIIKACSRELNWVILKRRYFDV